MYKILAKLSFGHTSLHYLPSCHSTNEIAQNLVRSGSREGTVVITDDQFAGKGQAGNSWLADPGKNLTLSLVLKPTFINPGDQFIITMAISLAISNLLEQYLPGEAKIKWPNDIYYKDKKIAGILIENVLRGNNFDSCIVGIGLNVNQQYFENLDNVNSMSLVLGQDLNLNTVLNDLLTEIDISYTSLKENKNSLQDVYHKKLLGRGEERKFKAKDEVFSGVIQTTDEQGRLIIWSPEKTYRFNHKEVEFLF